MFGNEDCKMVIANLLLPPHSESNGLLSALKLVISISDHSLPAKYIDWSGIINLEGSNGC